MDENEVRLSKAMNVIICNKCKKGMQVKEDKLLVRPDDSGGYMIGRLHKCTCGNEIIQADHHNRLTPGENRTLFAEGWTPKEFNWRW